MSPVNSSDLLVGKATMHQKPMNIPGQNPQVYPSPYPS